MINRNRFIIITTAVAVLFLGISAILAVTGNALGNESERTFDENRTFAVADVNVLDVSVSSTQLSVTPTDADEIEVRLSGHVRSAGTSAFPRLRTELDNGALRVRIEHGLGIIVISSSTRMEILVPRNYGGYINLAGSSSDITVRDLGLNEAQIQASSGQINLQAVRLVSGQTGISASSGDVILDIEELAGNLVVETTSGSIEARIPRDAGFELDARVSSGDISVDFPITLSGADRGDRDELIGTVGDGTQALRLKASSGNIEVVGR